MGLSQEHKVRRRILVSVVVAAILGIIYFAQGGGIEQNVSQTEGSSLTEAGDERENLHQLQNGWDLKYIPETKTADKFPTPIVNFMRPIAGVETEAPPTQTPDTSQNPQRVEQRRGIGKISTVPVAQLESSEIQALREVQNISKVNDSNLIGGSRAKSVRASAEVVPPKPTDTPVPEEEETTLPLVHGQSRGYTMLYLMHPKARATVEKQIEILLQAQIREVYLGVLTDGTFTEDYVYLSSILQRLASAGRVVTLVVYLTNGSAMRSFEESPVDIGFNDIEPIEFRNLIQFDPQTRFRFSAMVNKVVPTFELNSSFNAENKNFAIVMLEDNLDRDSYRAMRGIAASILGSRAELLRNSCFECYEGNDEDSLGDGIEGHNPNDLGLLSSRDGFSLDGVGYTFPNEPPSTMLTIDHVMTLETLSLERGIRFFGLWRPQRQGLGSTLIHPDDRQYEVPTEDQMVLEIEMLRHGLAPFDAK